MFKFWLKHFAVGRVQLNNLKPYFSAIGFGFQQQCQNYNINIIYLFYRTTIGLNFELNFTINYFFLDKGTFKKNKTVSYDFIT